MPLARRTDPNRCPTCRERVSPFAAGCAHCGADLDARRHHAGPGRAQRLGSGLASLSEGPRPRARLTGWRESPAQFVAMLLVWTFGGLAVVVVVAVLYTVLTSLSA